VREAERADHLDLAVRQGGAALIHDGCALLIAASGNASPSPGWSIRVDS